MISQLYLAFVLLQQHEVSNPSWPNKQLLIGHRGARARAPENTIPSFKLAMELGADGIEFDVYPTKDKVLFVIHDDTLERTTDGKGIAWKKDLQDLQKLDASKGFPSYKGVKLPTLLETLESMPDGAVVNIELKGEGMYSKDEFATWVLQVMQASRQRLFIIVSSFDAELLEITRKKDPTLCIGFLLYERNVKSYLDALRRFSAIRPDAIHISPNLAKPWLVRLAHSKGLRVMIWTVNDNVQSDELLNAGVDGIFSDLPEGFLWKQ